MGAEARSEAAAINPYVEWQSEGLGSDRTLNAQDSLRIGTPFNFFGQMGPARDLARTTEEGLVVIQRAAVWSTAVEATRRWLDLAAAMERLQVRRARLERLDTALALLEARHQLGEVAGTEVAQLDLEHTDAASLVAAAHAQVEGLRQAVAELCGAGYPDPRLGDLKALAAATRSPDSSEIYDEALALGVPMQDANTEADIEKSRARMAAAAAWGRPLIEAEWEHFAMASRQSAARGSLSSARAALAVAEGAEARLITVASAVRDLPRIEESLFAQFRLGALTYLEYVYGMVRHDDLLLTAINAHADLLLARLQLSYQLNDPSVFPTATFSTGEDS